MTEKIKGITELPLILEREFRGWDAHWIEHGSLTLVVVPQVGGRIMGVLWKGQELSFVNPDCQGRVLDIASVADIHRAKQQFGFLLWGGDKTWLAPQGRWTDSDPFLDLDSGTYEMSVDPVTSAVTMISPVCRETGVQIERTVSVGANADTWTVASRLTNTSGQPVRWAPWDVDMMLRPATVFMPTSSTSVFPQGVKTFDNEGESASVRDDVVRFVDDIAVISCKEAVKFKYGVDAEEGRILAVFEPAGMGPVGYRKTVPTYHPQPYGHGCVLEIFNSSLYPYIEMEVHGPVIDLQPGQDFTLRVDSALFDLDAVPATPEAIRTALGFE